MLCPGNAPEPEQVQSEPPPAPGDPSKGQNVKRLRFDGAEGQKRKVKLLTACMGFKSTLFGTGKHGEVCQMVADDLNKYCPEEFFGMLKKEGVSAQWNQVIKEAEMQAKDKKELHHLLHNGSILREMSELERLLDEIWEEKTKADDKKEQKKKEDEEEEKDARERTNAAVDRVQEQYEAGQVEGGRVEPDETPSSSEKSYGRGTRKGNDKTAGGNPGLSPDPKHNKLAEACAKQEQMADSVSELAAAIMNGAGEGEAAPKRDAAAAALDRGNMRAAKMQACAALMDQYLKFTQAGVEIPAMMRKMMEEDE